MFNNASLRKTFSAIAISALSTSSVLAADIENTLINDHASGLDYVALGDTESPEKILVLLHGAGDNYKNIASLGQNVTSQYDDLLVIVPNSPKSLADILLPEQIEQIKAQNPNLDLEQLRNWTIPPNIEGNASENEIMQRLEENQYESADALNSLIASQLDKFGLEESDASLYGFSAGGTIAMYAGLRAASDYAGILNHSGAFYGPYENPSSTPPLSFIVGDRETAFVQALPKMIHDIEATGITVTAKIMPNTGHELSAEVVEPFYKLIDDLVGISAITEPSPEQPAP